MKWIFFIHLKHSFCLSSDNEGQHHKAQAGNQVQTQQGKIKTREQTGDQGPQS